MKFFRTRLSVVRRRCGGIRKVVMTGLVRRYIDKLIGLCKLDLHKSILVKIRVINKSPFAFDFLIIVPSEHIDSSIQQHPNSNQMNC